MVFVASKSLDFQKSGLISVRGRGVKHTCCGHRRFKMVDIGGKAFRCLRQMGTSLTTLCGDCSAVPIFCQPKVGLRKKKLFMEISVAVNTVFRVFFVRHAGISGDGGG